MLEEHAGRFEDALDNRLEENAGEFNDRLAATIADLGQMKR